MHEVSNPVCSCTCTLRQKREDHTCSGFGALLDTAQLAMAMARSRWTRWHPEHAQMRAMANYLALQSVFMATWPCLRLRLTRA